jgi:hypothetical protein
MNKTIEAAANSGSDSFSLSILTPLPGTPLYRQVITNNLWWKEPRGQNNFSVESSLFRNSLIRVDGFDCPEEFESWVDSQNHYLNSILESVDPDRSRLVNQNRGAMLKQSDAKKIKQT